MPSSAASLRVLQCVAAWGVVYVVQRTISAASMRGPRASAARQIACNGRQTACGKPIPPAARLDPTDAQLTGDLAIECECVHHAEHPRAVLLRIDLQRLRLPPARGPRSRFQAIATDKS